VGAPSRRSRAPGPSNALAPYFASSSPRPVVGWRAAEDRERHRKLPGPARDHDRVKGDRNPMEGASCVRARVLSVAVPCLILPTGAPTLTSSRSRAVGLVRRDRSGDQALSGLAPSSRIGAESDPDRPASTGIRISVDAVRIGGSSALNKARCALLRPDVTPWLWSRRSRVRVPSLTSAWSRRDSFPRARSAGPVAIPAPRFRKAGV
jgi:hypothetical protein